MARSIMGKADAKLTEITTDDGRTFVVTYVGPVNPRTGRHPVKAMAPDGTHWHGQAAPGRTLTLRRAAVI